MEPKDYIIKTVQTLLTLEEPPYQLAQSQAIDKFVASDQQKMLVLALPTKEFKVLSASSAPPTQGTLIQITKLPGAAFGSFFNFSLRPAQGYRDLVRQLGHVYQPIAARTQHPSLVQVKELKAVLDSQTKKQFTGEDDLSFTSLEEELDFWQEVDLEKSTPRVAFFLREYAAISKNWRGGGVELNRLSTLIQTTWTVFFNIWNSPHKYPEKRFVRLVEVFEEEVKRCVRSAFARESDLLEATFDIRQMLVESIQCCNSFMSLLEHHTQIAKRKPPALRPKVIEELKDKVMATYRTKSKVEFLMKLFNQSMIQDDPASLMFLVRAENFMSSFVSQFKNNPKAVAKLEKEKDKLTEIVGSVLPIFESEFKKASGKENIDYTLRVLERWYYFLSEPQFASNTTDHQDATLQRAVEYLEGYLKEQNQLVERRKTEPEKLRLVKAQLKRFKHVDDLMREFGDNSGSMPAYRKKYDKLHQQVTDREGQLVSSLVKRYEYELTSEPGKLEGRRIAELRMEGRVMQFRVDPTTDLFISELGSLIEMGYQARIPSKLLAKLEPARQFQKDNAYIGRIQSRYNWLEGKLQYFQEHMVTKELNEIEAIVGKPRISNKLGSNTYEWRDKEELDEFINTLSVSVDRMTNYLKLFNASEQELEEISLELLGIQYHPNNFRVISQKLEQMGRIMDVASVQRESTKWRNHWFSRIKQVIEVIWQQTLVKGLNIPMTLHTSLQGGKQCVYEPDLVEVKENLYREMKQFIGWPLDQKMLEGAKFIENASELVIQIYEKAEQKFEDLEIRLRKYRRYEETLSLDLDALQERMDKENVSSQELVKVLSGLKEVQSQVEQISQQQKVGSFFIDNSGLQESLKEEIGLQIEGLTGLIKYSIRIESEQVEEFISNVMGKLEGKPKNMEEMAEAIKDFDSIKVNEKEILAKIKQIEAKNMDIRSITGDSFNTVNMLKRWENFQMASVEMNNILRDQKNRLQEDTVRKSHSLQNEASNIYRRYEQIKPRQEELRREEVMEVYGRIKDWWGEWKEVEGKFEAIQADIRHFNMEMPPFHTYNDIKSKLERELGNWLFFMKYREQVEVFEPEEWITFRTSIGKYQEVVVDYLARAKQLPNSDAAAKFIREVLEDNKEAIQLLRCISGQNFEKEHWGMLFSILKIKNVTSVDKLTFGELLSSDLLGKANEIRELEARSRGEMNIRVALDDLEAWSITREFELTEYNSMGRNTSLIKEWKEVMTEVSDHQALINSVKDNKYATRFRSQIENYEGKFGVLDGALLKLNQIQRKWIYLEPIFMRGALPEEQGRWRRLDEDYRNIMNNISLNPHVIELASIAGFLDTLNTIMAQLERCQKALNDYLEEKRNKFPRFYFLGDDDMLQILGQSQNPTIIQLHLKKLFSGIHTVHFGQNNEKILAMRSHLKEEVKLSEDVQVSEVVENWLNDLNRNMVTTLKGETSRIKREKIQSTFSTYSSQVICLLNELTFNSECGGALKGGRGLDKVKQAHQTLLQTLTQKCHQTKEELVLAKIKSLILDVIHQIAIVEILIAKNISDPSDWNWYKQLKFTEQGDGIRLNMANAVFQYSFEYQGNAQKLVYTPLTDKCYLTLTQAMHMGLGGNPYGPAGTGKTESVKALALAFGRQVLVFNCDEGLDFQSMGRIFIGLVKCGAWGCFDEFNRLLEEQLSAISQQIQVIQEAIKARQQVINLLGKRVEVNFNSGIFVTLNPAGKGYGGRSKLPDNLKQLFRPVAMSIPDNELIAEVLLFAEGFTTAKVLSQKIIAIFTLSKQLLSRQLHYDWGLRALKTILTVAGRLVFEEKDNINDAIESQILIKALRINTISKLTFTDMLKFNVLVKDVFPGTEIKDIIYEKISGAVKEVFQQERFEMLPNQLNKILQFYEATKQRIGAVLVGPSGCGKTTIWRTLKKAYQRLKQPVRVHLINPKAMPRSSFLGYMNNDTRQFSEGVLTVSARQVIKEDPDVLNWIICDGDVDPEWIEALNSVLDDNHLLTLPTGQRISFGANVNFIFETDNLQFASPATVSRMGMIYMNDEDININSIILKWTKKLGEQQKFIGEQVGFIEEMCQEVGKMGIEPLVATTKVGLVRNALSLLEDSTSQQEFRLNLVKGLASNFNKQDRGKVFEGVFGKAVPGDRDPLILRINNGKIGAFKDEEVESVQRIYATKEIKKDIDIVSRWLKSSQNVIIVGKQGCGKSLLLEASIQQLQKSEKCRIVTLHCNRQSRSSLIIQKLYQTCLKATSSTGKILRPNNCNRQIFVLKQVNLPKPDKYNTMELITFLQSLIAHEGFYDHNLDFVRIGQGIQFVCIIKPSSTIGRFQLTTRFVSNLRVLSVDYDSVGCKQKLETLTPHAETLNEKLQQFWQCIHEHFKPDDNAHYLFCPRNLNAMVDSLETYDLNRKNERQLLFALRNEAVKQFGDRLVNQKERSKFEKLIDPIFGDNAAGQIFTVSERKLKATSREEYLSLLAKSIKDYESDVREVNLVMVEELVNLMSSLERKLIEGGAMLMAGMSGSLRKTALRIVAHRHGVPLHTLSNTRNPSLKQFYKDLRAAIEVAAGQNKQIVLLLEEHQLGKNEFYEKINSLISSGEISGLFNPDQLESFIQDVDNLRSQYYGKSLYESFVERVRRNVVIVLSLDHRNKEFYEVCSANPAFYSQCRIIWLNCYGRKSMSKLFQQKTKELKIQEISEINKALGNIHEGSSLKYMKLIENFLTIHQQTQAKSGNKLEKLTLGLKKLGETAKTVDSLTAQAKKKKKLLTVKQKEADESLNYITDAMQQTSASKAEAEKLQSFLEVEERKIERDRKVVMHELEKVLPLIEQAKQAVGSLSPKNIQQIRSFMNPPDAVRFVLKAVLALFGNKDDSWNSMKNFLKSCKDQILVFDINTVSERTRKEVEAIITEHSYSFQRQNVKKASQDAVPLADWVKAAVEYSRTFEKVRPLQENLDTIEKELAVSKKRLNECVQKVETSEARIKELNEDFVKKTNEAEVLKEELRKAENAMSSGQELLSKLEDEKVRWGVESDKLRVEVEMMPRYAAMTACFVTYLSQSPENIRHLQQEKWKKQLACPYYNFLTFSTTEAVTLQQVLKGLPNDQLSVENSQILAYLTEIPLIIDPHTQATTWLKQQLQVDNKIETLTQQDPKFLNTLELAIRFGKTLIIQEIDFIEPVLTPILKKDYSRQGARNLVQIGEKSLDVNDSFKLFLTTRNSSIDIAKHQADLVSAVNFSVTKSGLEGKLLSLIITHFQPQIEQQKQTLLEEQEKLKINLSDLQQKLLKQLADSSGNILENKGLINSLNETKSQSQVVTQSLRESEKLQRTLDEKRAVFQVVSQVGAKLYISLSILRNLNPMYKFNLAQFIGLFHESLEHGSGSGQRQIESIQQALVRIVFNNISVALVKSHRLLLALVFVREVYENSVTEDQFNALLGNIVSNEQVNPPKWLEAKDRQKYSIFHSVLNTQENFNTIEWEKWHGAHEAEKHIPSNTSLSRFEVCLLSNACRPDRLPNTLTGFVQDTLGLQSLSGWDVSMRGLIEEKMKNTVPSLFIVSIGFDPSKEIQEYAVKTVGRERFEELSMGGDQNEHALELLRNAAKEGKWLCLKNLHLVISFVSVLEKEVLSMQPHQNFRLFLTTEAHPKFPPILLETCYKVSYEAPPGIKQNFTRLLGGQAVSKDNGLEMIATYLHSVLQQRRNYIPQGWNKFYEFNYGDYKSGLNIIREVSSKAERDWEMLLGLMLDTIYGGRIDNDVDRKLLSVYLSEFFNSRVEKGHNPIYQGIPITQVDKLINSLPNIDSPDIYNLPKGIDKAILRIKAKELVENLKIVTLATDSSTKFSRQAWSKTLTPLMTLWKGLLKQIKQANLGKIDPQSLKTVDPIESFVYGEFDEAIHNFTTIRIQLKKLEGVLFGNDILTTEIEELGQTLMKGETPLKWRKIWEGPDLVSDWLKIFMQKLGHLEQWRQWTQSGRLLEEILDLSEVYRPEIFLNALKQKVGREKKVPVNQLKIKSSFGNVDSQLCVKLKNLILQGCSVSGNAISETKSEAEYQQVSIFYVYFNQKEPREAEYSLPFYTDMTRTTLLSMLPLTCSSSNEKLVLASAALLLKSI